VHRPSREVVAYDLATAKSVQTVGLAAPPSQRRNIESFLLDRLYSPNHILFLDCFLPTTNPSTTIAPGAGNCQLRSASIKEGKITTLVDLKDVFKETYSIKRIEAYDPERKSLILKEYTVSSHYGDPGSYFYYEVSLGKDVVNSLTKDAAQRRLHDLQNTEEARCRRATLSSPIFQKDQVKGVYPPQIQVGCVDREEALSSRVLPTRFEANNNPLLLQFTSSPSPLPEGEPATFTVIVTNDGKLPVILESVTLSLAGINPESSSLLFSEAIPAVQYHADKQRLWIIQQWRTDELANRAGRPPLPPEPVATALIPFLACHRWLLPGESTSVALAAIPADASGQITVEASVRSITVDEGSEVYLRSANDKGSKIYTTPNAHLVKLSLNRAARVPPPKDGLTLVIPSESVRENRVQTATRQFVFAIKAPSHRKR